MNRTVIYSDRKTVSIQVKRDGSVVIRAPYGMSRAEIDRLTEARSEWIEKKRGPRPEPESRLDTVRFIGTPYPVVRAQTDRVCFDKEKFILPNGLTPVEERRALSLFFKNAGKPYMAEKVRAWASVMRLPLPPAPKITGAKTRWGSCGGKKGNSINYAYLLLMTDEDCIDYVTVHELAHTVYHNHGKEFYALVSSVLPDYRQREEKLREYEKIFTKEGFYEI